MAQSSMAGVHGPTPFKIELLPARVAYLISPRSRAGFRRAVQEATTRWAGVTEPIIPVRADGTVDPWWRQVIDLAQLDAVVDVDAGTERSLLVASTVGLPHVPLSEIDRLGGPASWTLFPSPLTYRREDLPILPATKASLWQIVAAGDLTLEHESALRKENYPYRRVDFPDQIARNAIWKTTMLDRNASSFGEHWARNAPGEHPAIIWITQPNSLKDCLYFWNSRAIKTRTFSPAPMLILPSNEIEHWLGFAENVQSMLARPQGFSPDVIINSLSVRNQNDLHRLADLLGLELSSGEIQAGHKWPAPVRSAPFSYALNADVRSWFAFERRYGEVIETEAFVNSGNAKLKFKSHLPFKDDGYAKIRIHTDEFDGLPKKTVVAEKICHGAEWEAGALRISTYALQDYYFDLRIPSLVETVDTLLNSAAVEHNLSDKGKIADSLLENSDTSLFLLPGVSRTISELTTPRSKQLLKELQARRKNGSPDADLVDLAVLWGGRANRRYRSVEQLPRVSNSHPVETLCSAGWTERGFQICCSKCGLKSFVPLPTVTNQPSCPGCDARGSFTADAKGLTLFYRLNTMIDQASDQGVLPHIIVTEFLRRRDPRTYILPGTDLVLMDGRQCEVDIFGVHAGRVIAGEVKSSSAEFSNEQISRDIDISALLGAEIHLMACMTDPKGEQIQYAEELASRSGLELLVMTRHELDQS